MKDIWKSFLIFTLVLTFNVFAFGQTDREKGIELYKKGRFTEAAVFLERASKQKEYKNDAEVWNYIGLSYVNQNKAKNGRKAFEKAVKYAPQNSRYRTNLAYAHLLTRNAKKAQSEIQKAIQLDPKNHTAYYIRGAAHFREGKNEPAAADAERALALDPKFTAAYILQADALLGSFGDKWAESEDPGANLALLERAAASLEKCRAECPKDDSLNAVSERTDTVKAFLHHFKTTNAGAEDSAESENKTPLNITRKSKPFYTDEARKAGEKGDVRIAVMFGADGKTKYLLLLKGLRYGLNEQALAAASQLEFEPEKIDGKPVSVVKTVVFTFDIY